MTSITPNTTTTQQRVDVTVVGQGFLTATSVSLNNRELAGFTVVDDQTITGRTRRPIPRVPGFVSVTVNTGAGVSASLPGGFEYTPVP